METKSCQNCKKNFEITIEDLGFYEKMKVPPPTFCPLCRAERRFVFRNEHKLFRVKDAFTGENIFSLYPPQAERKVVTQDEWFSDSWDPMDYARDYDFSRPFFEQLIELEKDVPIYGLNVKSMIRSDYCGNASYLKDCYLLFNSNTGENCLYGNAVDGCHDCVDNSHIADCERCYECFWLKNCYQCYFTIMSVECQNMWFSRDCLGCSDCFGCTNLRKSSYCIFNKQYSKDEYKKEIEKMELDTAAGIEKGKKLARDFWQTQPIKFNQGLKNLNSTGSYVSNCKNVKESYLIRESENLKYCQYMQSPGNKDCMDGSVWGQKTELCYETSVCGENAYNLKFSLDCWPNVRDCEYSMHLKSSSDCFGCVGLKNKQYCILNKQYTKEEYEKMVEKIKNHMNEVPYIDAQGLEYKYGEFFPVEFSPFGYNNTIAIEHFSTTEEEVKEKGYPWIEVEHGNYAITKKASELPESITEVDDGTTKEVIECESCKRPYRIMENELNFLRRENIPLPRRCVDCRHARRISDRLKLFLYERSCMCDGEADKTGTYKNTVGHVHDKSACPEKFKTGYSPDCPEIVYCEKCYQQEVY